MNSETNNSETDNQPVIFHGDTLVLYNIHETNSTRIPLQEFFVVHMTSLLAMHPVKYLKEVFNINHSSNVAKHGGVTTILYG